MNQQLRLPAHLSESTYGLIEDKDGLLNGTRIRWSALTQPERLVCLAILLIPLWWLLGWSYLLLMLTTGIGVYEFLHRGAFGLQHPSLIAFSAVAFGLFRLVSVSLNTAEFTPHLILGHLDSWISCGLLIWYIQTRDIQVRPQVIAWAFSIIVIVMLVFWLIVHFVFGEPDYTRPLSLFGLLTNKNGYEPGAGPGNYLGPYNPRDKALAGLSRFSFFFVDPQSFAMVASYIGILALDIKNRLWSLLLFLGCVFLLILSGTRANWIVFPLLVLLRYLWTLGKVSGPALLCALIAMASFITLSMPPATDLLSNKLTNTAEATGKYRADSTEGRKKIYQRTLNAVLNEPDELLLGRGVPGPTVVPGYEPARIGTHNFFLGTLLYQSGLVGTVIFLIFWVSLILWFYNTRNHRPISSLLMLLCCNLTFLVMDAEMTIIILTLLPVVRDKSALKLLSKMRRHSLLPES